jgi:hypothetical protein
MKREGNDKIEPSRFLPFFDIFKGSELCYIYVMNLKNAVSV